MKKYTLFLTALLMGAFHLYSSNFQAGDKVSIDSRQTEDQYLAGEEVNIDAVVSGDIVVGAGKINVNDTVYGDLLLGGGEIQINSYVGDDARISGGQIHISGIIEGDLIVFGGEIWLYEDAEVRGDVVAYGGELILKGRIGGAVLGGGGKVVVNSAIGGDAKIQSGQADFNGAVEGNMSISGEELEFGSDARVMGELRYWAASGEMDLSHVSANVIFDSDLAIVESDMDWGILAAMMGMGVIAYWVIFILSTFMVLLLLQQFFGKYFEEAARVVSEKFVLSFGYGMLYFIGIPVLSVIMFIIIIGFPIGVLTLSLYLITLLFVASITGLTMANYFKIRYNQNWTYFQTVAYALITVIVLKVIFWIPFVGWLLKRILAAAVYGAMILMMVQSAKKKELPAQ